MALDLVSAMDSHHQGTLSGGASLNKALAIIRSPLSRFLISETSLRNEWSRYKPMAHLCAGFSFAFEVARRESPDGVDEWTKCAYHEELHVTLRVVAAYQRLATGFRPDGQSRPLLTPQETWLLLGIEAVQSSCSPTPAAGGAGRSRGLPSAAER